MSKNVNNVISLVKAWDDLSGSGQRLVGYIGLGVSGGLAIISVACILNAKP